MGPVGEEAKGLVPGTENGGEDRDVGQVRTPEGGVIGNKDVPGPKIGEEFNQAAGAKAHGAEVDRDVGSVRHEVTGAVEQGAGKIEAFAHVDGEGGAFELGSHFLHQAEEAAGKKLAPGGGGKGKARSLHSSVRAEGCPRVPMRAVQPSSIQRVPKSSATEAGTGNAFPGSDGLAGQGLPRQAFPRNLREKFPLPGTGSPCHQEGEGNGLPVPVLEGKYPNTRSNFWRYRLSISTWSCEYSISEGTSCPSRRTKKLLPATLPVCPSLARAASPSAIISSSNWQGLGIDGRKYGAFDEALDPGPGKPVGAQKTGIGGGENLLHAEAPGDPAGMLAARSAEGLQGMFGRIVPFGGGDLADGIGHGVVGDGEEAFQKLFARTPALFDHLGKPGLGIFEGHGCGKARGIEPAEEQVDVGQAERAPETVTGGTGMGAALCGPTRKRPSSTRQIEPPPAATVSIFMAMLEIRASPTW